LYSEKGKRTVEDRKCIAYFMRWIFIKMEKRTRYCGRSEEQKERQKTGKKKVFAWRDFSE